MRRLCNVIVFYGSITFRSANLSWFTLEMRWQWVISTALTRTSALPAGVFPLPPSQTRRSCKFWTKCDRHAVCLFQIQNMYAKLNPSTWYNQVHLVSFKSKQVTKDFPSPGCWGYNHVCKKLNNTPTHPSVRRVVQLRWTDDSRIVP